MANDNFLLVLKSNCSKDFVIIYDTYVEILNYFSNKNEIIDIFFVILELFITELLLIFKLTPNILKKIINYYKIKILQCLSMLIFFQTL